MSIFRSPGYARTAFEHALHIAADPGVSRTDRWQAASMMQFLTTFVPFDEARVTDVMNVIARQLADAGIVFNLLNAIRRGGRDHLVKLTVAVQRLCKRAAVEGLPETLNVLVAIALEVPPWRRVLREEWVCQVVTDRLSHGRRCAVASMLGNWLEQSAEIPDWVCALAQQHPALVVSEELDPAVRSRLRTACSAEGRHLPAATAGEGDDLVVREVLPR
jgi:hypothetical protein